MPIRSVPGSHWRLIPVLNVLLLLSLWGPFFSFVVCQNTALQWSLLLVTPLVCCKYWRTVVMFFNPVNLSVLWCLQKSVGVSQCRVRLLSTCLPSHLLQKRGKNTSWHSENEECFLIASKAASEPQFQAYYVIECRRSTVPISSILGNLPNPAYSVWRNIEAAHE